MLNFCLNATTKICLFQQVKHNRMVLACLGQTKAIRGFNKFLLLHKFVLFRIWVQDAVVFSFRSWGLIGFHCKRLKCMFKITLVEVGREGLGWVFPDYFVKFCLKV